MSPQFIYIKIILIRNCYWIDPLLIESYNSFFKKEYINNIKFDNFLGNTNTIIYPINTYIKPEWENPQLKSNKIKTSRSSYQETTTSRWNLTKASTIGYRNVWMRKCHSGKGKGGNIKGRSMNYKKKGSRFRWSVKGWGWLLMGSINYLWKWCRSWGQRVGYPILSLRIQWNNKYRNWLL